MSEFSDIGKYLRIPTKFLVLGDNYPSTNPAILSAIAEKLIASKRNYLPIIIEEIGDEKYKVLLNGQVVEAAREAKLDFVWCILADEKRRKQIEVESKQKFAINILTASEETIAKMLEYIKIDKKWNIDPKKAAKAIVKNRNDKWKTQKPFTPMTKLSCGIGKAKFPILHNYFVLE